MVASGLLPWVHAIDRRPLRVGAIGLWQPDRLAQQSDPLQSVGIIVVGLALVALVGLLFRQRWLTALAAVLGLTAGALFLRSAGEVSGLQPPSDLRAGGWALAAGCLLVLAGSLVRSRRRLAATDAVTEDDRALIARNLERMVPLPKRDSASTQSQEDVVYVREREEHLAGPGTGPPGSPRT